MHAAQSTNAIIDVHVHIVGDGSSGSGCWLKPTRLHRLLARYMLHHLGLPQRLLRTGLDELYVTHLLEQVRSSQLDKAVILAQDHVYDTNSKLIEGAGSFYVPNEYVLSLAGKHPEFLAGVSIHPARPDALEELERCLEGGASLLKFLPNCQIIECSNPRYKPFWQRMADAKLPLLAHTGGEHTLPVLRPDLSDPQILRLPLECGVTVIAAHSATNSGLLDKNYYGTFKQMLREHPSLYGDNSAFNNPVRSVYLKRFLEDGISERIVHGSDYPVPVLPIFAYLRRFISHAEYRETSKNRNALDRDYQLKKHIGWPDEVFTRAATLLRPLTNPRS